MNDTAGRGCGYLTTGRCGRGERSRERPQFSGEQESGPTGNGLKAATSKSKGSNRGEIVKQGRMSVILGRLSVMIGTLLITLPSRQSN